MASKTRKVTRRTKPAKDEAVAAPAMETSAAAMPKWHQPVGDDLGGEALDPKEEKMLDWILNGVVIFILGWLGLSVLLVIGGYFGLWK